MNRRAFLAGTGLVASLAGCLGSSGPMDAGRSSGALGRGGARRTARRAWGEAYLAPDDFRVRIERPTVQPTYQYRDRSRRLRRRSPPSGGDWAFAYVWARNESDGMDYSPELSEVDLFAGGTRTEMAFPVPEPAKRGISYRDDGGCECKRGELVPGSVQDGWIAFVVPAGTTADDVAVVYTETYPSGTEIRVTWAG